MLEVKGVWVHYGGSEALKGICVEMEEGEIVTLLGANGAGKSTILRAISGLKRPTSGEIWFQGARIDMLSSRDIVAAGISHVPEGRRLFPFMRVLDNLELGAYLRKDREGVKRDLEEVFNHFPVLGERRNQAAGTLSGGEQQMLAVARALMNRPKLMLMDEPSLGLSPLMVDEVAKIIADINRRGVSIILVEQNAYMALNLASRGYVLQTGTIVSKGNAEELLQDELVRKAYLGE